MRLFLFLIILCYQSWGHSIIFGADNRKDVIFDPPKNRQLAPAIAMSFGNNFLIPRPPQRFDLDFYLASDSFNVGLCAEERFSGQYANWLNCTGFLVTEDVMVTAGHCLIFNHSGVKPAIVENTVTPMCQDFSWLFDFKAQSSGQAPIVNYDLETQMAACRQVIYAHITPDRLEEDGKKIGEYGLDFSIIRLDRPLRNRRPLRLSNQSVRLGQPVAAVTHPSGLPLKVSSQARVLENHFENYFTTDLDIASGSSGGPVFNAKNEVIGLVVRASPVEDYIWNPKRDCATSYVCKKMGAGLCNEKNGQGGYPLGTHVHKIEPILKKLKELGLLKTDPS